VHKILRIDGHRHDVSVRLAGGSYELSVGDAPVLRGERRWEGARLVLTPAAGGRVEAHLTRGVGGRLELWLDSERHVIEEERRGGGTGRDEDDDALVAPMPARVVRIEVAPGDVVEEGQTLVVLESMKMELAVTAPRAGRVAKVGAVVGVIVPAGTTLIELDPRPEEEPS
jgi:biotin carboxyl carrier protein